MPCAALAGTRAPVPRYRNAPRTTLLFEDLLQNFSLHPTHVARLSPSTTAWRDFQPPHYFLVKPKRLSLVAFQRSADSTHHESSAIFNVFCPVFFFLFRRRSRISSSVSLGDFYRLRHWLLSACWSSRSSPLSLSLSLSGKLFSQAPRHWPHLSRPQESPTTLAKKDFPCLLWCLLTATLLLTDPTDLLVLWRRRRANYRFVNFPSLYGFWSK